MYSAIVVAAFALTASASPIGRRSFNFGNSFNDLSNFNNGFNNGFNSFNNFGNNNLEAFELDASFVSSDSVDFLNNGFNSFDGFSNLANFDNFFGNGIFDSSNNLQVLINEQELACQQELDVNILQQRLAIVQEFTKSLVRQQLCQVEAQVLVLQQFQSGIDGFINDIRRLNSNVIAGSFDQNIASLITQLVDSNGLLTSNDFGFLGSQIGQNSILVADNWLDATSPASVEFAFNAVLQVRNQFGNVAIPVNNANIFPSSSAIIPSSAVIPSSAAVAVIPSNLANL